MKTCRKCGSTWEHGTNCPNCGEEDAWHLAPLLALGIGAVLFLGTAGVMAFNMYKTNPEPEPVQPGQVLTGTEAADASPEESTGESSSDQELPVGCLGEGTYEVGVDIPAGEYVALCDGTLSMEEPLFHIGIYPNAEMNDDEVLYSGWFFDNTIFRAEEGQFIDLMHGYMYESSGRSLLDPFENSGMFHVGRDIPPGTYTVVGNHEERMGIFEVFSDLTYEMDNPRLNDVVIEGYDTVVTLKEGEYIQMLYCCLGEEAAAEETTEAAAYPSTIIQSPPPPEGCLGEGTYEVGSDIPAGEYVIMADGVRTADDVPLFYISISPDEYVRWLNYNTIVRLEEGRTIEIMSAYMYECSSQNLLTPFESGGTFHVGRDLPAGTYTVINTSEIMGFYRVYTDITLNEEVIRIQNPVYGGESAEITVKEGEYLQFERCELQ